MNKTETNNSVPPNDDLLLQEMWRIKDKLSASYGHSVKRLFEEARKREKSSGHPIAEPPSNAK